MSIHKNVNKAEKVNSFHLVEGNCCSLQLRVFRNLMVKGKDSFVRGGSRKRPEGFFNMTLENVLMEKVS